MLAFADDAALARLVIATWARDCARPARDRDLGSRLRTASA